MLTIPKKSLLVPLLEAFAKTLQYNMNNVLILLSDA